MAKKILLKRWDGTSYDEVLPKTSTDQVIGLSEALGNKVNVSDVGEAGGIASLDTNAKVPISQLPDDVITGMSFQGTLVNGEQFPQMVQPGYDGENVGKFWIITNSLELKLLEGERFKGADGTLYESEETIEVQSGDWIIVIEQDVGEPPFWSIVDNNQSDKYLSKSGGTLYGNLNMDGNDLQNIGEVRPDAVRLASGATTGLLNAETDASSALQLRWLGNNIFHKGNEDTIDAGKLSGQDGAYYRNATNINAGTLSSDRLDGSYDIGITGNAATASAWETKRDFTFTGDVTGSVIGVDGTGDRSISLSVTDDSHSHTNDTVTSAVSQAYDEYFPNPGTQVDIRTRFSDVGAALKNKNRTELQATAPSGEQREEGDLWFDTNN